MRDLAAPALDERDDEPPRRERPGRRSRRALRAGSRAGSRRTRRSAPPRGAGRARARARRRCPRSSPARGRTGRCRTRGRGGRRARRRSRAPPGRRARARGRSRARRPRSPRSGRARRGTRTSAPAAALVRCHEARTRAASARASSAATSSFTPPGHEQAPAEPVPAELGRDVQEVGAERAAVGRGRQEADVVRERAEVADVVRHALELERDAPERHRPRRPARCRRATRPPSRRRGRGPTAVSPAIDSASASERRSGPPRSAASTPRCWYPSTISRWNTCSPWHWKRKWPGLDDPRVHGADRDLVDLLALDGEERVLARQRGARVLAAERVRRASRCGGSKRSGFSHGWPSGRTPSCSAISRSKPCAAGSSAERDGYVPPTSAESSPSFPSGSSASTAVSRTRSPAGRPNSAASRPPARSDLEHDRAEPLDREHRHLAGVHRLAVPRLEDLRARRARGDGRAHGHSHLPPTSAAAAPNRSFSPCGRYSPRSEHERHEHERRRRHEPASRASRAPAPRRPGRPARPRARSCPSRRR